jgi:hypothetical protein
MAPDESDDNEKRELLKLLNDSGFPFQMAVTQTIQKSSREHHWKVVTEEHPWKHAQSHRSGFVDQIIRHEQDNVFRALLECKRQIDGARWVFLKNRSQPDDHARLSVFWTIPLGRLQTGQGWIDFDFNPLSPESSSCVIFGDSDKRAMFEHIADVLLPATEAVGLEEAEVDPCSPNSSRESRCYLPIVVTNAALHIASFDPGDLDLKSGRLPSGACEFKEVPCVRFRKSLGTHVTLHRQVKVDGRQHEPLAQVNLLNERTILVLNADCLRACLKELRIPESKGPHFGRTMDAFATKATTWFQKFPDSGLWPPSSAIPATSG